MTETGSTDSIQLERNKPIEAVPQRIADDGHAQFADSSASGSDTVSIATVPSRVPRGDARSSIDRSGFEEFRRICSALRHEVSKAKQHLTDGVVDEFGLPAILHIEDLLDELFDCDWGQSECLQRVTVAIESQIKNVEWTSTHVGFLEEYIAFLACRYLIDEFVVSECIASIKSHGLDPFRGTVAEPERLKEYRIVEWNADQQ